MKNYKLLNNIVGWGVFLIAATVYLLTIEPTASFWDCGEFIATAFKLEVGHPPGAPLFMIMGRFFSLFAGGNLEQVPVMINSMSALASAFTILFLFWTITHLTKKMIVKSDEYSLGQILAVLGSGAVGALAYTFSDSFWFSAVEGEVYASSSFFSAIVFWSVLKWEDAAEQKYANRWLIFIAYLMGLSIGVHLLNLLAIPAIVFVYYFKKNSVSTISLQAFMYVFVVPFLLLFMTQAGSLATILALGFIVYFGYFLNKKKAFKEKSFKGLFFATGISIVILGAIMYGIVPYTIIIASWFELAFVNGMGLPFNSGLIFYLLLLLGSIVFGLFYTAKRKKVILNTIILAVTVILIGYSSFAMIYIRSMANPPMDENNPENVFALLSYLNREQYGDRPLFIGQYYNAPLDAENGYNEGDPVYIQQDGKYVIADNKTSYNYDKKFTTFMPRMYSSKGSHIREYKYWAKVKGKEVMARNQQGAMEAKVVPTFSENMRFFFDYQMNFMYFRYFMWNFAGRQNDIQGHKAINKGNWISGISFIDEARIGPLDAQPSAMKNNKANNKFYFLPLLLGLIGLIYQFHKHPKGLWVVFLLFFFTGIAIVIYLNQYPLQPRERDYAYVGSFYAFAIWIGMGVFALYRLFVKKLPAVASASIAIILSGLFVPALMASQTWDDHDRSERYTARDFAKNYLNSCAKNAILFTNGDNDTFPLWYAQEVEGIRTDIRIVNLSLFNTDWYIDQMKRKAYDAKGIPNSFVHKQYVQGVRDIVYLLDKSKSYVPLKKAIEFVKSDNPQTKLGATQGKAIDYTFQKLRIPVDSALVVSNGTVMSKDANKIVENIDWQLKKTYMMKNELMVLDMIAQNNWERPIYFAITVGRDSYLKLQDYFQLEGLTYRLVPIKTKNTRGELGRINTDIMYENMMNKFVWGGINNPKVYLDENNRRMTMNLRSNFSRLAQELIKENKIDSAITVLDKCMKVMPEKLVPHNYFSIGIAEAYFKTGKIEVANEIILGLAQTTKEELNYFVSLQSTGYYETVEMDARQSMAIMQELVRISKSYNQTEISESLEKDFIEYYGLMQMSNGR